MYKFQTAFSQNTFVSLKILEALMQKDLTDEDKAKIIAEGFAELETRYPDLKDIATKTNLSETELKLIKEIKELEAKTSKEIKELDLKIADVELRLSKEIKDVEFKLSKEMKEVESKLSKEIKELDLKIADVELRLSKEIKETKSDLLKWSFTFWISQMAALIGIGFFVYKALHL